jgi:hypothetical protein
MAKETGMAEGHSAGIDAGTGKGTPPREEWARRADETLVWHLDDARRVEMAAQAASTLEYARRVWRHGAASPAAAEVAARLEGHAGIVAELGAEIERIRVPVPPRDPKAATIYGRVLDARLSGYRGAKVVAMDAAGKVLATSTTDVRGCFLLAIGPTARQADSLDTASAGEAAAGPAVRLVARAAAGTVLVEEGTVEQRSPGTVVYRELVIPR